MDKSTKKDREQNQVTEPKGAKKSGDKKKHPDPAPAPRYFSARAPIDPMVFRINRR